MVLIREAERLDLSAWKQKNRGKGEGTLHIRKCPFRHFKEFSKTVGYDKFVGKLNISEITTMKSLYGQFGGIYCKQGDYLT